MTKVQVRRDRPARAAGDERQGGVPVAGRRRAEQQKPLRRGECRRDRAARRHARSSSSCATARRVAVPVTPGTKIGDLTAITGEVKTRREGRAQAAGRRSSTARSSRSRPSSAATRRSDASHRAPRSSRSARLSKYYRRGDQIVPVLVDINLDVAAGDFVALMGPSGSGKSHAAQPRSPASTSPTAGAIRVGGVDIAQLSEGELADWRAAHVGFIFQFYNLMPVLTAFENVELPLLLTVARRGASAASACETALALVGPRRSHGPLSRTSSPAASSSASRSRARSSPTRR